MGCLAPGKKICILNYIFKKQDSRTWNGFIWLKTGTSGDFHEHGYELPSFIIYGEILMILETIRSMHEIRSTDLVS